MEALMATRRVTEPAVPEEPPAEQIQKLSRNLQELIEESEKLRVDVKAAEEQRRKENMVTMGVGALMCVFLFAVMLVAIQNNRISASNAEIAKETKRSSERLFDCTLPEGKCHKESQKRTGKAVGDIARTQLYIVECSRLFPDQRGPAFDKLFEKCVADRLTAPPK
jgi:hypothetical protein